MASCLQRQEFYLAQSLDAQGWRLGSPIDWASPENLKVHHIMEMCALGKAWDHTAIQLRLGFHNPSQNHILDWCNNFPLDSTFLIFHIQQWPPGAKLPTQISLKNKSLPNPRMPSAQPATAYWSKEGMGGGWEAQTYVTQLLQSFRKKPEICITFATIKTQVFTILLLIHKICYL